MSKTMLETIKEYETLCKLEPSGYVTDLSKEQLLDYRMHMQLMNILTSKAQHSFMSADVAKLIIERLGLNSKGIKKGKFIYE